MENKAVVVGYGAKQDAIHGLDTAYHGVSVESQGAEYNEKMRAAIEAGTPMIPVSGSLSTDGVVPGMLRTSVPKGENRTTQRLLKHKWVTCLFSELTSGCTFRMFEEDGTPVVNRKGETEFIAAVSPTVKDGVNTIKVY